MLGDVLAFDHHPEYHRAYEGRLINGFSLILRNGSYVCQVVYSNIKDGKRAVRLDGTTLGDRAFTVTPVRCPSRFRRRHGPSERIRRAQPESVHRTALISELPAAAGGEELVALCGGSAVVSDCFILEGGSEALVEFVDRPSMLLAFERLKVATLSNGNHAKYPLLYEWI